VSAPWKALFAVGFAIFAVYAVLRSHLPYGHEPGH
jgi:hypothetical protein